MYRVTRQVANYRNSLTYTHKLQRTISNAQIKQTQTKQTEVYLNNILRNLIIIS